jgi:hypothetical protein
LALLVNAMYSRSEPDRLAYLQEISTADYLPCSTILLDVEALKLDGYDKVHSTLDKLLASIPKAYRNAAAVLFIESKFSWLPNKISPIGFHASDNARVGKYIDYTIAGRRSKEDGQLCDLIMSGALHADETIKTLVTGLVVKGTNIQAGRKRLTSSKLMNISEAALNETGFALSLCVGQAALYKLFGLNPKGMARVSWLARRYSLC